MLNHPQHAQVVIDQRWADIRAEVARGRLAGTPRPRTSTTHAWLQGTLVRLSFLRPSPVAWRPSIRRPAPTHHSTTLGTAPGIGARP